jgi:adenylate cyclase
MNKVELLKRHAGRMAISVALMVLFLLHTLGAINLDFLQRLESYTYDIRLQWTMPNTLDKRIVILDIDEKSLQEQGHWPWPRHKLAQLINTLFDQYQINALGFDILFAERDESSGLQSLEVLAQTTLRDNASFQAALEKLKPRLNNDQLFADSLKNRRVVLGYYFQHDPKNSASVGTLPAPALAANSFNPRHVGAVVASGFSANLAPLQHNSAAGGYFNASPLVDSDGVFRRISLLQMYDGALYESLGLAVARLALQQPPIELNYEGGEPSAIGLESLQLGTRRIPVDMDMAALIPYHGKQGSFPYLSASAVLQGKASAELLRGAIVLVGTTAPGLMDLRTTPVQESYPGVEVHANLIAGILDNQVKAHPAYTIGYEFISLLLVGVLLALALPLLSPLWATTLSLGALALLGAFNLYIWQAANQVLPIASAFVMTAALFVFNMSYGFFIESHGKRSLAKLFGQYVPPELVDEMAKDPGAYTLSGESRELTVLFTDVRGFTTISEGLDPQQLTQLMNEFLTPMTQVIHRHRGTIDKYMGDAIMAFWGAPLHDPEHARHALQAALDMVASLDALRVKFKARGWPPINIGVGLNTGDMTVGNMGSEFRLAYTVMGDAVNLGSRLEGLTKEYGVQIIVSEYTRAAVPDFVFRELDCVRVKGKDKPVRIYQPLGAADEVSATELAELAQYHAALQLYRAQQWELAQAHFTALQLQHPARELYALYAQRSAHFRAQPPGADWDGAFTFLSK